MDDRGMIHRLTEAEAKKMLETHRLVPVPPQHEAAAEAALAKQESMFLARDRRARGWAKRAARALQEAQRQKSANRRRNKAARKARRNGR